MHAHPYVAFRQFFHVDIPEDVYFLKLVVVPISGDPDIFISFDHPTPTGLNSTFEQVRPKVAVLVIGPGGSELSRPSRRTRLV